MARTQGSQRLENPQAPVGYYGYDSVDNTPPLLAVRGGPTQAAEQRVLSTTTRGSPRQG